MNQTVSRLRILVLLAWAALIAWWLVKPDVVLPPGVIPAGAGAAGEPLYWFKGNTHSHARLTVGDYTHGDSTPEEVAAWYRDHGYHFMALTDHNSYSADLGMDREGFLVIPGMEVTSDHRYPSVSQEGERMIHATALNTDGPVEWAFTSPDKAAILDEQARRIRARGGVHILNHPNYRFQVELADILAAGEVRLMEVYNAHPRSIHAGHSGFRPGVEELWDRVLGTGRLVYGVAADDAHDFRWYRQAMRRFGTAPPGGAWIMVRASRLDAGGIGAALERGDFYASTGVHLSKVSADDGVYEVTIDMNRTRAESGHRWVRTAAPVVASDDSHFVIEFIGPHGRVLHATHDHESARLPLQELEGYVRAKITYLEKAERWPGEDRARAFYAWTQPAMLARAASGE